MSTIIWQTYQSKLLLLAHDTFYRPDDTPCNSLPYGTCKSGVCSSPSIVVPTPSPVASCDFKARKVKIESTTGAVIQMLELQVFSSDGSNENIAFEKNAYQSSTFKNFDAFRAVDGVKTPPSFSHTDPSQTEAWLVVDLETLVDVGEVKVLNRSCKSNPQCLCRLTNATVSLLDESDAVITTRSVGDTCGVLTVSEMFCSGTVTPSPTASPTRATSCSSLAQKVKIESTTGQPIQVFEIQTISAGLNVALRKSASQSSTLKSFEASRAVDGGLSSSSFSHTDPSDSSPWLQVDLGEMISVEEISIVNRYCEKESDPKGCLCRLSHAKISLLTSNDVLVNSAVVGETCGDLTVSIQPCSDDADHPPSRSPSVSVLPSASPVTSCGAISAQKVRITSTTGKPIQVFEVQVVSSGSNVAFDKEATQSSTLKSFSASLAVDGEVSRSSFSHTNPDDSNPFWEVDLGESFVVDEVSIVNRYCVSTSDPRGCLCRLSHATISLLDVNGNILASESAGDTCDALTVSREFCLETPPVPPTTTPTSMPPTRFPSSSPFSSPSNSPVSSNSTYSCEGTCIGSYPFGCATNLVDIVRYGCHNQGGCNYLKAGEEYPYDGFCTYKEVPSQTTSPNSPPAPSKSPSTSESCDVICEGSFPYGCATSLVDVVRYGCKSGGGCSYLKADEEYQYAGFCTYKEVQNPTSSPSSFPSIGSTKPPSNSPTDSPSNNPVASSESPTTSQLSGAPSVSPSRSPVLSTINPTAVSPVRCGCNRCTNEVWNTPASDGGVYMRCSYQLVTNPRRRWHERDCCLCQSGRS